MTDSAPSVRLGLMGGTFDPIHYGHMECALRAREQLGLDEVLFVPAGNPSFKQGRTFAPAGDRLAMCELACADDPAFRASDIEVVRPGVTYSVDTVRQLLGGLPLHSRVFFIVGSDAFLTLPSWKSCSELAEMTTFAVLMRPGDDVRAVDGLVDRLGLDAVRVSCPKLDISSSYLREALACGNSIRYLVPDSVRDYIASKGLYSKGAPAAPIARRGESGGFEGATAGSESGKAADCAAACAPEGEDALSRAFFDARLEELSGRVSAKRLRHVEGVFETAARLAETYGEDVGKARLAGLLHDWDKGMDDDEIRQRARELGIVEEVGPWVVENMPQVLHGPTAAAALSRAHPQIPADVIQAVRRHTTGACDMSPLDKIVYVADALEPGRNFDGLDGLQAGIGRLSLDDLFFEVYRFWTMSLLKRGAALHPDTMSVWNAYAAPKAKPKGRGKKRKKSKK